MDEWMGEFFGFGEDLKHIRYDVPWQVGFSGRVQLHSLAAVLNPAQSPLLNPSSSWYNPLTTNDKPAQEDEES